MTGAGITVRLWVDGKLLGEQPILVDDGIAGIAAGLILTGAAERASEADVAGQVWMIEVEQADAPGVHTFVRFGTDQIGLTLRAVEVGGASEADVLVHVGTLTLPRGADGESFRCPVCQMVSHHPLDVLHGWCGNCHAFTGAQS